MAEAKQFYENILIINIFFTNYRVTQAKNKISVLTVFSPFFAITTVWSWPAHSRLHIRFRAMFEQQFNTIVMPKNFGHVVYIYNGNDRATNPFRQAMCRGRLHGNLLTSAAVCRANNHLTSSTLLAPTHFCSRLYPASS